MAKTFQSILLIYLMILVSFLPFYKDDFIISPLVNSGFFALGYGILPAVFISVLWGVFTRNSVLKINLIDGLLLLLLAWITLNKFVLHQNRASSVEYYEWILLLGLYAIVRYVPVKWHAMLLLAICISGAAQAIYGNLQLWGVHYSNHGLFKMTGSFFNPGPFAGYLCIILPVAVGLYWMYRPKEEFGKVSMVLLVSIVGLMGKLLPNRFRTKTTETKETKKPIQVIKLLIPYLVRQLSGITIISIILVLPAARSRAAWLGAIAGVGYLACKRYNVSKYLLSLIKGRTKSSSSVKTTADRPLGNLGVNLGVKTSWQKLLIPLIFILIIGSGFGIYLFKKDSADGRLFIWKNTWGIIKDHPMTGVGQGMFPAYYMMYQADHFKQNPESKYERVAGDNKYVFNEPLKIWVENGVIGFVLMLLILFWIFKPDGRRKSLIVRMFECLNVGRNKSLIVRMFDCSNVGRNKSWNVRMFECSNVNDEDGLNVEQTSVAIKRSNAEHQTVLRAAILAIFVFGLFGYPSEITSINVVAVCCLGMLASCSSIERNKSLTVREFERSSVEKLSNEVETQNTQTLKQAKRSNIQTLKQTKCSNIFLKVLLLILSIPMIIFGYLRINQLHTAYVYWNDANDMYQRSIYEESLEYFEDAYPVLKHNGEFLLNYGKALSIAEKHEKAIGILNRSEKYLTNTITYTALGDSYQAQEKYIEAERSYQLAYDMAPDRYYAPYLLAKLYEKMGENEKSIDLAKDLIAKDAKIPSTAVDEIIEEMRILIERLETVTEITIRCSNREIELCEEEGCHTLLTISAT